MTQAYLIVPAIVFCLALAGCGTVSGVDRTAVNASADQIQARIVAACTASGLFKAVDGTAAIVVPVAALPVAVLNAGVDVVCANPARFARDAGTGLWVARNLKDILAAQRVDPAQPR